MIKFFRELNSLMDKPRYKMTYREYYYLRSSLFLIFFVVTMAFAGFAVLVMELKGF